MRSATQSGSGKSEIRALIPHAGSMCLLDEVMEWDEQSIVCSSKTHLDLTHPLKRDKHLSAIHAFEYGAQAVAAHGGLRARSAGSIAPPGYLAALRDASICVGRLDDLPTALEVRAQCLFGDSANSVYQCHISVANIRVAQGRVTIISRGATPAQKQNVSSADKDVQLSQALPPVFKTQRRIPFDHPSLPGHFPGEPIVPGVVILDEVAAALSQWRRQCQITRIHFAKFLSPLRPEQIFAISLFAADRVAADIVFHCHVDNRLILDGRLEVIRYD